jgi:hypothetical protein
MSRYEVPADMFADDFLKPKTAETLRLEEDLRSDDPRTQLMAVRDYLINELTVNRCQTCTSSKLRTGDTAALVLRLTTTLKEIAELPNPNAELDPVEEIQQRRNNVTPIRPGVGA